MARKSRKGLAVPKEPVKVGMKIWLAALYIRLSVEDKGKHGDSLDTQQKIMEAFLALHPEIRLVQIYTDNGTTGRTFERPGFEQMLADIEGGKIDCILVKDLSRLGRNTIDTGYYIEKYFPIKHIRFIAVNDQYDSENSDNDGSHIVLPLKNMVNEAYAFDISRKIRAQAHQSMKAGDYIGARPPYGYKKAPENCHKLIVNEDTAPVALKIFEWAAQEIPLNVIVKRLNEAGVLSPGYYAASQGLFSYDNKLAGNGKWQTWTVTKILNDEVYTGDMVQGKTKAVGHKQVPVKPEDWIVVPNTHEAIISHKLFEQVRDCREQTAVKYTQREKIPYTENILRGRIFCAHCGKNLHRQKSHDKYWFHCISNDRIAKGTCPGFRISENELFQVILTIIRQKATNIFEKNLLLQKADSKLKTHRSETEKQLSALRQEVDKSRGFLKGLYQNFVTGILTGDEYLEMKANYEVKIQDVIRKSQDLESNLNAMDSQIAQFTSLADRLEQMNSDTEMTAMLVDQLIDRITVYGKDDIKIDFRFQSGFELVEGMIADE